MFYQNMPLYLKLITLLKTEYVIFHNLPKAYKYSLGQDILNRTWNMIDLFMDAQSLHSTRDQAQKEMCVRKINIEFDSLKLRIRFLTELQLISLGQAGALAGDMVEIGKMIGSWLKNV